MRIVVLTGMSGSGKSNALRALEDIGYYCIDNLPIRLLDKLLELFSASSGEVDKLALVIDARSLVTLKGGGDTRDLLAPGELEALPLALEATRQAGHEVSLVFLDSSPEVLARRYSETRRRHPLSADGSVQSGIAVERALLEPLQQAATTRLDTSSMSVHDLKREIQATFAGTTGNVRQLSVTVLSFGFKHGLPAEADLVLDVRFIPNPYFVEELRPLTGRDEVVAKYVLERPEAKTFLERLGPLLEFLIPQYDQEGKAYLTLAIGCTGGRHRSVALAGEIARFLAVRGIRAQVRHRDVDR
ncbi:MAG: RNase adapter RapZ [Deltaproteobacteria bacterium]|nr:RNase adapter RapZ [Deltaproteobacteria bacterium]